MDREERTAKLMELGYLMDINLNFWLGSVLAYPVDLGVQKQMLPLGRQSMQVMSKPWVKKVTLLRGSIKRSQGFTYSHLVNFEGGKHRFVLKGAAGMVAESLDAHAERARKFYQEIADDEKETKRIARQVISKNADYLWKAVCHLFPKESSSKAPGKWKAHMIESIMSNRFPAPSQVASSGLSYSMYNTKDAGSDVGGKFQKPFPGLLVDCGLLTRDIHSMPMELFNRIQKRIPVILRNQKKGGIHAVTVKYVQRDLMLYNAFNPIPVEGHGMEQVLSNISGFLQGISPLRFRERKEYREELVQHLLELCRVIQGPWTEHRQEIYKEIFGEV